MGKNLIPVRNKCLRSLRMLCKQTDHSLLNMQPSPPVTPSGVLLIDKAHDMTSHDVVAIARGALGIKKIGHCGTLDPMATGLLMLVIGKATKLQDQLMAEEKTYEGTLTLGATTSSQDKQGDILEEREVPSLSPEDIDQYFQKYLGAFEQIPPMVSAIKKNGVPLYKLARKGKEVKRDPRPVSVKNYTISNIALPEVSFTVECSKGFYVRTYAHDIGQDIGCGAHLSALRRTKSGYFDVSKAISIDTLKNAPRPQLYESIISIPELSVMRDA